ncbi:slit homolog 1 protein-like [Coccinella septempunctata]|uniref:slit homolog 1 protein-like n=1 Tax=Coccinella septempunctata TaxID=41139 RepID=UPI001D072D0F|nr:slit homolog 1 protein-like [Coccinella septempunctata]
MGGETTRPMFWRRVPTLFLLAMTGFVSVAALCPVKCRCNETTLSTICTSAHLEVIPLQLNPDLRHMDLSNNKISNLYYALSIYENLLSLDLSTNNLSSLGSDKFKSQINLRVLNVSRNTIEKLKKDSFNGLKALVTLDLSYNRLEKLHNLTFLELHSLRTVVLSGNRITHLERGLLKTTKHLKELVLDNNQLLEIPSAVLSDAIGLQRLILSQNLIYSVDEGSMPTLSELRSLSIDGNVIRDIHHAALTGLPSLERLDLSDNNFTNIPTASLSKLSNLTWLKLSGNFVEKIPPVAFRGLFQLKYIHLDRLDLLEKIDVRGFVDNINLERIWLNDNIGLKSIPTRLFHGNPKIVHISIRNNALTTVEATHFPLDQLRLLQLGGNPLECNCSLLWLWHLAQDQKKVPIIQSNQTYGVPSELHIDSQDINCAAPETLHDKRLLDVAESEINCSFSWIAITSAVISVLFVVVILTGLVLWGPLKRSHLRGKDLSQGNGALSCGRTDNYEPPRIEKCIVSPPASHHHDYRTLSSWEHYGSDYGNCMSNMNIYEQLDCHLKDRPHIVYNMKFNVVLFLLGALLAPCLCFNGNLAELECPDECECHYFRINWVTDCSDSHLSRIPYEDISLDVYILDLNDNSIADIEPFPANIKMRRLQLSGNKLTALERRMFAGLYYLIDADFSYNNISKVDPDAFSDSTGFITLEMHGNPLDPVEGPFLSQLSLLTLDISNCGLKSIHRDFFANLTSLSDLDISNNPLGSLQDGIFEPLASLESLKMNNCNLSFISNKVFEPFENLKHLELDNNNFHKTNWILVLDKLIRLEHLNLRNSGLRHLHKDIFKNNIYMRTLVLAENDLNNLDVSSTLQVLHHLDTLDLSNCNLSLPLSEDAFINSTRIRSLYLSGNSLFASDLLVALSPLADLQKLSLSNCGLSRLPDIFNNFKSLHELDLSHNPLNDVFVKLLSPLENLEYLNMGYSNLSHIAPKSFSKMTSMRRLVLAGNDLNNLETGLFGNLTKLESLDLSFCGLKRALNASIFFNNLTYEDITDLQLAGNPLKVPQTGPLLPRQLSRLRNLDLSNCNLTFLPAQAFHWTRNITTLILAGNMFNSSSDFRFLELLADLQSLDLRNNKFTKFDLRYILPNQHLNKLKLIGNPWKCECYIAELWDWAVLLREDPHILEGTLVTADNIKTPKIRGQKLLTCSYDNDKIPSSPNNVGAVARRRSFKNPQRVFITANRTWAKYVRESGCEQRVNHTRLPRSAAYQRSNLGPNNWGMTAINTLVVYATIMAILGVAIILTRKQRDSPRMFNKDT